MTVPACACHCYLPVGSWFCFRASCGGLNCAPSVHIYARCAVTAWRSYCLARDVHARRAVVFDLPLTGDRMAEGPELGQQNGVCRNLWRVPLDETAGLVGLPFLYAWLNSCERLRIGRLGEYIVLNLSLPELLVGGVIWAKDPVSAHNSFLVEVPVDLIYP
jgi:hypothetical protein